MKILVVGKFYVEGFAQHIAETLADMGHVVARFEPGISYGRPGTPWAHRWRQVKSLFYEAYSRLPQYQQYQTKSLLATAQDCRPDLILSCHDFLTPAQVALLKQATSAKIAMWFPDAIVNFHRAMFLVGPYDAIFFKDPYIVKVLRDEVGKHTAHYLPECCNPKYHYPVPLTPQDEATYGCDITTAGNMHSVRAALFEQLSEFDCKVWGLPPPLWLNSATINQMVQNKFVVNEEKSKAFRAAKIVVNSTHPGEIDGTNLRTFEVAGAGGFQLANFRPALADLFVLGQEIETFRSVAELKEKVRYFLARPEQRRKIADAGAKRAQREHTYELRLGRLISVVFGQL
jgi:spore maturation protein CgeB